MAKRKSTKSQQNKDPLADLQARLQEARLTAEPEKLSVLLGLLGRMYLSMGKTVEAEASLVEAYEIAQQAGLKEPAARHLGNLGIARLKQKQLVPALECFDKVLLLSEENQFQDLKCDALLQKAGLHMEMGRGDLAHPELEEALKIAEETKDQVRRMHVSGMMGISYLNLASVEEAARYFESALEIAVELKDSVSQGGYHTNLGSTYLTGGAPKAAATHYELALKIARQLDDKTGERNALHSLVKACAVSEDEAGVTRHALEALRLAREENDGREQLTQLNNLILTASKGGKNKETHEYMQEALQLAEKLGDKERQLNLLTSQGNLAYEDSDLQDARITYEKARALATRLQKWDLEARLLGRMSAVEADDGNLEKSLEFAFQGMKVAQKCEDPRLIGEQMMLISMAYRDQKAPGDARKYAEDARKEFEQIEAPETLEQIDTYLNELKVLA